MFGNSNSAVFRWHQNGQSSANEESIRQQYVLTTSCPSLARIYKGLKKIIDSNAPICFQGEEGTGKESLARLIHGMRGGSRNAFCTIDGESATEISLEETSHALNGKGHDCSNAALQQGQQASIHTTLFISKVDALQDALQAQLLELIQRRTRAIPSAGEIMRSMRLITATDTDLAAAVRRKRFRQELYYRLTTYHFQLPSLRQRQDDIPLYIAHFTQAWCGQNGNTESDFSPEALAELRRHDWPGNLEELRRVVTQSLQQHGGKGGRITKLAWQGVPSLFAKSSEVAHLHSNTGTSEIPAIL